MLILLRILLMLFIAMTFTWAASEEIAFRSCGEVLAERLRRICRSNGGYNSMGQSRVKRGIVNECCQNKCFDSSLYSYCRNERETNSNRKREQTTQKPINRKLINSNYKPPVVELLKQLRTKSIEVGTLPPEYKIPAFMPQISRIIIR